jgi:hypothetical protein
MSATELKNQGNAAVSAGNYQEAIDLYTKVRVQQQPLFIKCSSNQHASRTSYSTRRFLNFPFF